jgi:hypothetical protein
VVLVSQFVTVVPETVRTWQVLPAQATRSSGEGDVVETATAPFVTPADASPAVSSRAAAANTISATVTTAERITPGDMSPPPQYLKRTTAL